MTARIVGLIALELTLVVLGLLVVGASALTPVTAGPATFATFVVVLCLLNALPSIYLEHRRHNCLITPADGAMIVGLFALGPVGLIAASLLAELVDALRHRQPPLKLVFNQVSLLGGWTAAAATFAVIGRTDPHDPLAWAAGVAAMAACALWDVLSTASLFAIVERRPFREMINGVGPALLVSLVLSASLGLVALVLLVESPVAVLLVVPVIAILVVSSRSLTAAQAERNRLERLHRATGRLARLVGRDEMLATIASEGRRLISAGAAAICASRAADGSVTAILVDDDGVRALADEVVDRLVTVTDGRDQGALTFRTVPLHVTLPSLPSVVWATGTADPDAHVLLAVLLEVPADDRSTHRVDVLATFAAHAATVVANVDLHQDVQAALDHQLALNRQKSEFVAAVSHELRTPLAGIIGALQTVRRARDRMSDAQLEEVLGVGTSQGARLRGLIEDLLLVAAAEHRAVTIAADAVDLDQLLGDVAADQPAETRRRLHVRGGGLPPLRSDREKLHRIVGNLVDNARKYAPHGRIDLEVAAVGTGVRITVEDRGPGIAPADRERIFERFVQLDQSATRRQGGTGLGLHLCRQLAELLGGELTVEGGAHGGARFVLTLPRVPSDGADPPRNGTSGVRDVRPGILPSPLRELPDGDRPPPPTVSTTLVGGSS